VPAVISFVFISKTFSGTPCCLKVRDLMIRESVEKRWRESWTMAVAGDGEEPVTGMGKIRLETV